MAMTKLANLVNPQVMADMISADLPKAIKFSPIATIDTTLVGVPGSTITVPKYAYIGDAEDVAEGVQMGTTVLTTSTTTVTVKKSGKAIELTDEAVLSGYGDPLGEGTRQLTMSIANKIDNDCLDALYGASLIKATSAHISYDGVVDAIDLFDDENDENTAKIMFVHPKQATTLRKDPDFKDKNKYPFDVVMNGVFGEIGGAQVIKSKKVKLVKYEKDNTNGTITIVSDETTETSSNKHLATIQPNTLEVLAVGDKVKAVASEFYANPIVVVDVKDPNMETTADDFAPSQSALTIYMKRDVMVENDRDILAKTTVVSADEHFGVALSNESKVVLAEFGK